MNITRRQLFAGATALSLTGMIGTHALSDDKGFLLGWGTYIYFFKSNSIISSITGLGVWSLKTKSAPHDFLKIGQYFCAMPKWGNTVSIFDVKNQKIIKEITLQKSEQFMGHGVYDPRSKKIYFSSIKFLEYGLGAQGTGFIKVYDSKTYELINEFPTHGIEPHECLVKEDKLIVLNTGINQQRKGSVSSIAILDKDSGNLVKKIDAPKDYYFAHFENFHGNKYFLCHEFPDSKVDNKISPYVLDLDNELYQLEDLGKVFSRGDLLTPAYISKHQMLAATVPFDNSVIFWNSDSGKHIRTITLTDPRAIFYKEDIDTLIVATKKGIYKIDPSTFNIKNIYSLDLDESISSHGYWV